MELQAMNFRGQSAVYPPVTEQLLNAIVDRITSLGSPLKIVLFGSRASGNYKPDSDIDILVIEESTAMDCIELQLNYHSALKGIYPEYTVIVRPLSAVEEWKYVPNQLITEALRKGKTLYEDRPRLDFLLANITQVAEDTFQYKTPADLARDLLTKANSDIKNAQVMLKSEGPYDTVCFHAQQAAEKHLKAFLALHGFHYEKTHELEELLVNCQTIQAFSELWELDLKGLSKMATVARYDGSFWPDQKNARETFDQALKIIQTILAVLPPEAKP